MIRRTAISIICLSRSYEIVFEKLFELAEMGFIIDPSYPGSWSGSGSGSNARFFYHIVLAHKVEQKLLSSVEDVRTETRCF